MCLVCRFGLSERQRAHDYHTGLCCKVCASYVTLVYPSASEHTTAFAARCASYVALVYPSASEHTTSTSVFCCKAHLVCRFGLSERQRARYCCEQISAWQSYSSPVRRHGKLSSVKFWSDPNMVLDHHTLAMLVRICAHFESNQLALFQPILTIHHPCQKFIPNLRAIRLFKPWRFPPFCLPRALLRHHKADHHTSVFSGDSSASAPSF